ncbi:hypothetical protein [Halorubrum sp. Atlit-26R]|uniref:hypothetical protein n=1 Tax=Halorubrum sp. Atlit-26R TaxID=2282128 RepID=UPI000EF275B1|nr:hypothetical protein [Halorubrum sp. Atlit-26R]RLM68471.1 hypothetical protein DVK07_10125 [Halorubrum sp. Atlit-26R]
MKSKHHSQGGQTTAESASVDGSGLSDTVVRQYDEDEQAANETVDPTKEEVLQDAAGNVDSTGFLDNPGSALIDTIGNDFMTSAADTFTDLGAQVFSVKPPETTGPLAFGEPKTGALFGQLTHMAWERTWPGSGEADIAALAVLTLVVAYLVATTLGMFRFGASSNDKKSLVEGLALIVMWFPLALFFIQLAYGITIALSPEIYKQFAGLLVVSISAFLGGPITGLITIGGILVWLLIIALLQLQRFMVAAYLVGGPLLIAGWYSNIPMLDDLCQNLLKKFLPLVLMPLPLAIVSIPFQSLGAVPLDGSSQYGLYVGAGYVASTTILGPVIFLGFGIIVLFAIWALFKSANQTAASIIGSGAKGAAALGLTMGGAPAAGRALLIGRRSTGRALAYGAGDTIVPREGDDMRSSMEEAMGNFEDKAESVTSSAKSAVETGKDRATNAVWGFGSNRRKP